MTTDGFFASTDADVRRIRLALAIAAIYIVATIVLRFLAPVKGQDSIITILAVLLAVLAWAALVRVFLAPPVRPKSLAVALLLGTAAWLFSAVVASALDPFLAAWVR